MTGFRRAALATGRAAATLGVLAASASPALAQADPGRVFRGLFEAAPVAQTVVALTSSVYEGFDSRTASAEEGELSGGLFSAVTPTLTISHVGQRSAFGLSATNLVRHYNEDGRFLTLDRGASFGLRHSRGRVALQLSQRVSHRPYYAFLDLASLASPGLGGMHEMSVDRSSGRYALTSYATTIQASRQSSEHQWLSAGYQFRYARPSAGGEVEDEGLELQDVIGHEATVSLTRQISRRTGAHIGYAIRTAGDVNGVTTSPSRTHELNVGLDRFQSLSLTRNTSLSFSTGTGLLDTVSGMRLTLLGAASLDHRFGRGSRATIRFRRALDYVDGIDAPVLRDAAIAEFDVQLAQRLVGQFRANVARGTIQGAVASAPYTTAYGSARMRFDFSRRVAGYAEYFDYYREFAGDTGSSLVGGSWHRHGVRVGVMVDVPLYSDRGAQ
jgi:hypothetical protein